MSRDGGAVRAAKSAARRRLPRARAHCAKAAARRAAKNTAQLFCMSSTPPHTLAHSNQNTKRGRELTDSSNQPTNPSDHRQTQQAVQLLCWFASQAPVDRVFTSSPVAEAAAMARMSVVLALLVALVAQGEHRDRGSEHACCCVLLFSARPRTNKGDGPQPPAACPTDPAALLDRVC